ncbi:MAG: acetyl/propionyl/methylcrotonyl-CoA carboxylase subunit alpha [SAR324 cluster bacterium]|nr:acetyl/propionyl/methylcrotonyl-CoA carboxylase subunit alpha [SAR324 cluster bacterium]
MFEKILIANRGEIACRIVRTCSRLGIRTVAVYSTADAGALHVQLADEAVFIGEAPPVESYLKIDKIMAAAKKCAAQAIHPGYGFLAENAEFARQCSKAGIVFIGPSVEAIEKMGAKDQAKSVMEAAGVPVVPGYNGAEQSPDFLHAEAEKIGYPLIIKAVLGGGGKGMRVVRQKEDFIAALESAKNEAGKAFGDERVILESFISGPRHIEFQIFGDLQGNVVHLFERDCSLQRRHQKIIEESPSPFLDQKLRTKMAAAAVAAANAVKYAGAGTVEFIVGADRSFFFMEMNTRLQVEHPVTEMISGLDLVEWQLLVAAGEVLPLSQAEIKQSGHAIEARIYAENPESGFLPSIGTLRRLVFPDKINNNQKAVRIDGLADLKIRIDTGVEEGGEISIHYDPMLAKLIVHSDSRKQAISSMQSALASCGVLGLQTNLGFLQSIIQHPDFAAAKMDTLFVDSKLDSLLQKKQISGDWIFWGTAIFCLLADFELAEEKAQKTNEPCSPWNNLDNWRAGKKLPHRIQLLDNHGAEREVRIIKALNNFRILDETTEIVVTVKVRGDLLHLNWSGKNAAEYGHHLFVITHREQLLAVHEQGRNNFTRIDPLAFEQSEEKSDYRLSAPMPGNVIRVLVKAGEKVKSGQALLVMEAMKMEHTIVAPADGIVEKVFFQPGELVQNDAELVEFQVFEN